MSVSLRLKAWEEDTALADYWKPDRQAAVADLALRRIFEAHFEEIRIDPELLDEIFAIASTQASSEELRDIAAQARAEGSSGIGYYLDEIASFRDGEPV
jgi:hypothetical protein